MFSDLHCHGRRRRVDFLVFCCGNRPYGKTKIAIDIGSPFLIPTIARNKTSYEIKVG